MEKPDGGKAEKEYIFPKRGTSKTALFGSAIGRAGVIGLHPLSGILVGGCAGYFLRREFDAPWIFWTLLLLGFIAGCRNAYRETKALLRDMETPEKRN